MYKWFLEGSNMGSKRSNQTSKLTKLKLFKNLIKKNIQHLSNISCKQVD
jgi:hypothetical protein